MTVLLVTAPAPIVSLADAKRQCRIDDGDTGEDAFVTALVATATATLDGPGGWLGRALGPQRLELVTGALGWSCGLELPYRPVTAIVSVSQDGVALASGLYRLDGGGMLRAVTGQAIPAASSEPDAVRIRYDAGWPITPAVPASGGNPAIPATWTGPAPIRHAILMMVARLYAQRGEDVLASLVEDRAINAMLSPYRLFQL